MRKNEWSLTHGMRYFQEYKVWTDMKSRCLNKKDTGFRNYGGRGIKVCNRWLKFENFYFDMGEIPSKGYRLDRIDNDSNYSKLNCRWATKSQQERNKRTNRVLSHNGRTMCVTAWAECLGFNPVTLFVRLNRGWSVARTLTKPVER